MRTSFIKKFLSVKVLVCLLTSLIGTLTVLPAVSLAATTVSVSPDYVPTSATSASVEVTFSPHVALGDGNSFTVAITEVSIIGVTGVNHTSNNAGTEYDTLAQTGAASCAGGESDPSIEYQSGDLNDIAVTFYVCDSTMLTGASIETNDTITLTLSVSTGATETTGYITVSSPSFPDDAGTTTLTIGTPSGSRYVAASGGTDSGSCTLIGSPCATLSYAISQANHGETIYLDAGTYSNSFTLNKAVNITNWATDGKTGNNSNVLISGISAISIPGSTGATGVTYSNVQFNNAAEIGITDSTGMTNGVTLDNVVLDFVDYVDASTGAEGCFYVAPAPNSLSTFKIQNSTIKDCGGTTSTPIFADNGVANFANFYATSNTIGTASTTAIEPITLSSSLTTLTFSINTYNSAYTSGTSILSATGGAGTLNLSSNTFNPSAYGGVEPVIDVDNITTVSDIASNSMNTTRLELTFADSDSFTVTGNTFESMSLKEVTGSPSASSVTVEKNKIVGATTNTLLDVEAGTVSVKNNVITSSTTSASLPATIKVNKGTHSYFNNTVVTNSTSPLMHITSDNAHTIKNNTMRAPATLAGTAAILKCDSIAGANVTLDYNNFYGTTNNDGSATAIDEDSETDPYITNASTSSDCARGSNKKTGDPEYEATDSATIDSKTSDSVSTATSEFTADALAGQFAYFRFNNIDKYFYIISNTATQLKLQTEEDLSAVTLENSGAVVTTKYSPADGSPLVDWGTSTGAPTDDIDGGTSRSSSGNGYDIGAYESAYSNAAPTISDVLIDSVAVASQANAGLYPTISWTYADAADDPQKSYRILIQQAPCGFRCFPSTVYDSGTVSSADSSVTLPTALTAATGYQITVTVGDGISTTSSSATTFTTGTPGITLSSDAVSATEGSTGTFTLVLDTRPADTVTITFTTANSEVTIDPSPVTFTRDNWDTVQTVTVTATDDSDVEGEHTDTITMDVSGSAASDYSGVTEPGPITVTITDNDSAPAPASSGGGGGSISSILNQTNTTSPSTTDENTENDTTETTDETTEDTEDITEPDPAINPTNLDSSGATGDFSQEIGITTVSPSINDRIQEITRPGDLGTGEFTSSPAISTTTEDSIRFQQLISSLDTTEDGEVDTNEVQTGNDFEILSKAFVSYLKEDTNRSPGVFSEYQDDDNDGIQNSIEKLLGTDPKKADSDGDGVDDGQEINFYGTSPKVANVNISKLINVNLPKSLTPRTQLPVAAPEGSQVTVYYLNRAGEKVFLTNGTTGRNNIVLLDIEDLPVDEEIRLVTEVITPDRQTREITSEKFRVKLSRLTADTAIVYIDGNRVRDFNRTYIVKNRDAVIEGQIPTPAARWNIASLVFGSMILTDSSAGQVAAKIPQEILEDPGVHQASLLAFDPETEEYSEPVSISFIYQPNRLLPDLAKGQLSIFDPGMAFLILLTLGALAIAAAGGLKYHQHREMKAAQVQTQTKDRS